MSPQPSSHRIALLTPERAIKLNKEQVKLLVFLRPQVEDPGLVKRVLDKVDSNYNVSLSAREADKLNELLRTVIHDLERYGLSQRTHTMLIRSIQDALGGSKVYALGTADNQESTMPSLAGKPLPRTVQYRGATYQLESAPPPKTIQYRGAKYVLALEEPTPVEEQQEIKSVEINVPSVVYTWHYFPGLSNVMDLIPSITTKIDDAYKDAMQQKNNGLKKIVDAGYDEKLRAILETDADAVVSSLDQFLTNFAALDAAVTFLVKLTDAAREQVLGDDIIKEMLPGDSYARLYNSALSGLKGYDPKITFIMKHKSDAMKKYADAIKKLAEAKSTFGAALAANGTISTTVGKKSKSKPTGKK